MDISTESRRVGFKHLAKRITSDQDTITYRILSRELGITVQESKQLLHDYSQDSAAITRGLSAVMALSGVLSPLPPPSSDEMEIDPISTMTTTTSSADLIPSSPANPSKRSVDKMLLDEPVTTEIIEKRTIILAQADELDAKLKLFTSPPSMHVYSLSPVPLDNVTFLTAFDLPLQSPAPEIGFEWKIVPSAFDYGGAKVIAAAEREARLGFGKNKGKGKQRAPIKAVEKVKETKSTLKTGSNSTSTNGKIKMEAQPKPRGKVAVPIEQKPARVSLFDRPMGQMGGLFAKKVEPVVPKKKKVAVVESESSEEEVKPKFRPKKEKTGPVKKAGKSNGIFADEEVSADESDVAAVPDKKEAVEEDAAATKLKEKEKRKKEIEEKKKAVKARNAKNLAEVERVRQEQELAAMMDEDDVKPKKGIQGFFK